MSKISIKLVIAGRSYPLTINESEEEAVRKAAEDINSNIQQLQQIYAVKDMQDLLAMTSLQLATRSQSRANPQKESLEKDKILEALEKLSNSIEMS